MNNQIQSLSNITPIHKFSSKIPQQAPIENNNFSNVLKSTLNNISNLEHESNRKKQMLALGKIDDLHDVMITAQKTSITIEAAVQIQQKVIDAYNEMMRMQV